MRGLLVTLFSLLVVAAACGDGGDQPDGIGGEAGSSTEPSADDGSTSATESMPEDDPMTSATDPSTSASSVTSSTSSGGSSSADGVEKALPVTSVTVTLDTFYDFPAGTLPGGQLPFGPGDIRVWWYVEGGHYTVLYEGLSPDLAACPGNSLQLASGAFDFVSNAALGDIDCSASPTAVANSAERGVVVCGPLVFYRTLIPADADGTLFGTVEIYDADLLGVGATSMAKTGPGQAAAIDLGDYGC